MQHALQPHSLIDVELETKTVHHLVRLGVAEFAEVARRDIFDLARVKNLRKILGEAKLSFSAAEVIDGAGSRYGPTAPLLDIKSALDRNKPFAFIGKPCDIGALRNYARHDSRVDELVKYWLTPVCGGFSPPPATVRFLHSIGVDESQVKSFSYRGYGCPGPTRVETHDGRVIEKNYIDLWGEDETQWSLPFRCKVCPDGIGDSADRTLTMKTQQDDR